MARAPRHDAPGLLHHVVSRGVGKRPMFERDGDFRCFLALLALEVRRGRIRVHAFALMHTHVHLLVESVDGELASAMQQILSRYVAWFNVTRSDGRKGHLVSQRYFAQVVEGSAYLLTLLRYIDANPVQARLARDAREYRFGSAIRFAGRLRCPPWLTDASIRRLLNAPRARVRVSPARYGALFGGAQDGEATRLVEARMAAGRRPAPADAGADLWLDASWVKQQEWLAERARSADGTTTALPLVPASSVLAATATQALATDPPPNILGRITPDRLARAGLLRSLASLDYRRIGAVLGCSTSASRAASIRYTQLLEEGGSAAAWLARRAESAILTCYGSRACAAARRVLLARAPCTTKSHNGV